MTSTNMVKNPFNIDCYLGKNTFMIRGQVGLHVNYCSQDDSVGEIAGEFRHRMDLKELYLVIPSVGVYLVQPGAVLGCQTKRCSSKIVV